jgi:hypothetical protein
MFVEINKHPEQTYQPQWHEPENPLMQGLRSVYNKLPVNARVVMEYGMGRTSPITEKDFSPEDLQAIRAQDQRAREQSFSNYENAIGVLNTLTPENAWKHDEIGALLGESPEEIYKRVHGKYSNIVNTFEQRQAQGRNVVSKYQSGGDINEQGWGNVLSGLSDPNVRIGTSLGRYNVLNTPQGQMAFDLYDFDPNKTEKDEPFSMEFLTHPVKGLDWFMRKYPRPALPVQIMLPQQEPR